MTINPLAPQPAATIEPGDLIDENAAASIMQVGVKTLRNWRAKGEGPRARKIGKRLVRYHRADLAAFINGEAAR